MTQKVMYKLYRNSDRPTDERRSLEITQAKMIVNLTVGNKSSPGFLLSGESDHTISLNKNQVAMVIAVLTEMHASLE